jgi:regulatory protein
MQDRVSLELQRAKNYAFLLLKFRLRSEKEIYQRLKKKKFPEGIIQETLFFLKDKRFIDDNFFAKTWIESRLKKPLGLRRIKIELRQKGIDKEIIDSELREIKKGYLEQEIVTKIAQQRLKKLKGIEPIKAKSRVYGYLLRRGFSPEIVIDVLNQSHTA